MNSRDTLPVTEKHWRRNFRAFLWHAAFLALASSFMDVDTVIPSMLLKVGGSPWQLGLLTAIMLGGSSVSQLFFAGFLHRQPVKKKFLLLAIHLRVVALLVLAWLFFRSSELTGSVVIVLIFLLIAIFSFSGAFANVSYVDILGKSVRSESRKRFFSMKQVINSVGILASAFFARDLLKRLEYPQNYAILFLLAGILLWVATGGFWRIREVLTGPPVRTGATGFLSSIPRELKTNPNLKFYLLTINSLGLGLGMLPFAILLAENEFGLGFGMIGNFLVLRTVGMLVAGLVLYRFSKWILYRRLLTFSLVIGSMIPLLCLLLRGHQGWYHIIFLLAGIFVATYRMGVGGVLLEISTNENRSIYAGISGAGNILTALFPLLAGWLIPHFGFTAVFLAVTILMASSYLFVRRLDCRARADEEGFA